MTRSVTQPDDARRALANVLGALALVVTDELGRAVTDDLSDEGHASVTDAAALSALAQFLDGATVDRVHQVLGVTPSGAVRLVDRLEAAGLVTRGAGTRRAQPRDPADRGRPRRGRRPWAVPGRRTSRAGRGPAHPDEVDVLRAPPGAR